MSNNITFVTAIYDIYNEKDFDERKTKENRIARFEELASTGIQISLFCCNKYNELLKETLNKYNNVKLLEVIDLSNTTISKLCQQHELDNNIKLDLPSSKHPIKDSREYMILINSKVEFTKKAIDINIWNSNIFYWIDFSIFYVLNNKTLCSNKLTNLKYINYHNNLYIDGCWSQNYYDFTNNVNWRFCGGIFYGTTDCINNFYDAYIKYFPQFLKQYNKLVWEVNFWHWLEINGYLKPQWYQADHNDSIILNIN
jgi:hypothetical protein